MSASTSTSAILPISPILFSLPPLRHQHDPASLPTPTIDTSKTIAQYIDEMVEKLHGHRCVLFDVPTLLYDERWLGTTQVRFHLPLSCSSTTTTSCDIFTKTLTPILQHVNITRGNDVDSNDVIICDEIIIDTQQKVDPAPVLKLTEHILWCEPNRTLTLDITSRFRTHTDTSSFDSLLSHELETCERIQAFLVRMIKQYTSDTTIPDGESKSIGILRKEKGAHVFHQMERIKQQLSDIYRHRQHQIDSIYTCCVCDRILLIHRTIPGYGHAPTHHSTQARGLVTLLQTRLKEIESKNGNGDSKSKRKRAAQRKKGGSPAINAQTSSESTLSPATSTDTTTSTSSVSTATSTSLSSSSSTSSSSSSTT